MQISINAGYFDVIDFAPHVRGVSELHDATLHEVGAWYSNGEKAKRIEELKTQLAETKRMWENSSRINRDLQEKLTAESRELHNITNHAHQLDEALKRTYRTCMDEIENLQKLNQDQQDEMQSKADLEKKHREHLESIITEQQKLIEEKEDLIESMGQRHARDMQTKAQDVQQYKEKLRNTRLQIGEQCYQYLHETPPNKDMSAETINVMKLAMKHFDKIWTLTELGITDLLGWHERIKKNKTRWAGGAKLKI